MGVRVFSTLRYVIEQRSLKVAVKIFVFRLGLDLEDERQANVFQHSDGLQTFTEPIHLSWTDLSMSLLRKQEECAPQRQKVN